MISIFLKRWLFKDIKNYIPMSQTRSYKNTNTQIHNYSIWRSARKTQHVVYFWKEHCSRISSESRTVVQGLVNVYELICHLAHVTCCILTQGRREGFKHPSHCVAGVVSTHDRMYPGLENLLFYCLVLCAMPFSVMIKSIG